MYKRQLLISDGGNRIDGAWTKVVSDGSPLKIFGMTPHQKKAIHCALRGAVDEAVENRSSSVTFQFELIHPEGVVPQSTWFDDF